MSISSKNNEYEKTQLLNSFSDAVKQCQLRFGSKRELATEMDSRVSILCNKLECLFLHGLKKNVEIANTSTSKTLSFMPLNQAIMISNKSKSFLKDTSSMLSSLLSDSSKLNSTTQSTESASANETALSFWPFIKKFMNKFDSSRYESLKNIKTDTGRHRAWLRSCLNEHSLEKYVVAVISNQELVATYYESNMSIFLDKSLAKAFTVLCSGLQSILFAINIDNPDFDKQPLQNFNSNSKLNSAIENTINNAPVVESLTPIVSKSSHAEAFFSKRATNQRTSKSQTRSNRRLKKPNQITLENEETDEPAKFEETLKTSISISKSMLNKSKKSKNEEQEEEVEEREEEDEGEDEEENEEDEVDNAENKTKKTEEPGEEIFPLNEDEDEGEKSNGKKAAIENSNESSAVNKPLSILINPIKFNKSNDTSTSLIESSNILKTKTNNTPSNSQSYRQNGMEIDNKIITRKSNSNLSLSSSTVSENSTNKYFLQELPYDDDAKSSSSVKEAPHKNKIKLIPNVFEDNVSIYSYEMNENLLSPLSADHLEQLYKKRATDNDAIMKSLESRDTKEMFATLIKIKDELQEKTKALASELKEEKERRKSVEDELANVKKKLSDLKNENSQRSSVIENENKLLKEQLKKYFSATKLVRTSQSSYKTDEIDESQELNEEKGSMSNDSVMHQMSPNLRDYSIEAEEYQKKLIQVAEMHGELMEFNDRLTRMLTFKNVQLEKLREELVELRGPLPNSIAFDLNEFSDNAAINNSIEHQDQIKNVPLVNIWIPSVFLRSNKSSSHHVYQIFVRIKDEEWNIYRRFSQFLQFHSSIKELYAISNDIPIFPKKKVLGNKDSKFVENRRKDLQDYLRQMVNLIIQSDVNLSAKPCKLTVTKTIPFLSERYVTNDRRSTAFYENYIGVDIQNNSGADNLIPSNSLSSSMLENNQSFGRLPTGNSLMNEPSYTGL